MLLRLHINVGRRGYNGPLLWLWLVVVRMVMNLLLLLMMTCFI